MSWRVIGGDCVEAMRAMPEASVDAIVTDPPYGLGFMGKAWDDLPPGLEWAQQCLRVLKPGGHLLAFGGTRTYHRLACATEDAGFEIRDTIAWLYGSGFPKSLDVSKAIDKARDDNEPVLEANVTAPATPEAEQWAGWGTALKPAHEPIVVARKPLNGTVAACVLAHGTGAQRATPRGSRRRGHGTGMEVPLHPHPTRICPACEQPFTPPRKYPQQTYCSAPCQRRACLKYDDSETQTRRGREGAAKSRATQLDRGEGKSYRKHHGRHEHRVIAERMLGRPLKPGEIVHHINGDKRDNRPANLQVLASQAEHARLHAAQRREVSP